MSQEELHEKLIDLYRSNSLISAMFLDETLPTSDDDFIELCIQLHNDGKIDLVSETAWNSFQTISMGDFFSGQYFFCKVLPEVTSRHTDMMRVTKALVEKGGNDLASNRPNSAFQNWCSKDIARARAVLKDADAGDQLASSHLTFALQSHNLIHEAISALCNYQDDRRLSAIAALSRMEYGNPDVAIEAIWKLHELMQGETDDRVRAHILGATFDIIDKSQIAITPEVTETIKAICAIAGDETLFGSARSLAFNASAKDEAVLDCLLDVLISVTADQKGTLQNLDTALSKLLDAEFGNKATSFIEKLIVSSKGQIGLSEFQSFKHKLISEQRTKLRRLVGSWLLSGQLDLCENLTQLFRGEESHKLLSDISFEEFGLSSVQHIFIARKAIGYFFVYPKVMAAILVALLRECPADATDDIASLLFDPLLVNYGGAAREYLKDVTKDDSVFSTVQKALNLADSYLADLQSAGTINELHPSASQRQVQRVRMREMSHEIHKQAEEHSVFLSLVHRSTLLYGRSSLSYFGPPGAERQPSEMQMQSHSVSFEMPRSDVVDPFGMDYMLRRFRAECLKT